MMRTVLLVASLLGAAVAQAKGQMVLPRPGNGVVLSLDGAVAIASHTIGAGTLDLNVQLNERFGERLHSRIRLIDGQRHAGVLVAGDDRAADLRFSFRRVGMTVEMTGRRVGPVPGPSPWQ